MENMGFADMTGGNKVTILPRLEGVGGPASFYIKIKKGILERGIEVTSDPKGTCDALLVIGGTNRLDVLWNARRNGVRIVQRLNGMNWVHRIRYTGIRHFLRSEQNNLVLAYIRKYLADRIVYQSQFSQWWWNKVYGATPAREEMVYNGIDLATYTPGDISALPHDTIRLLVVEGKMGWGHQYGLSNGYQLSQKLSVRLNRQVEFIVAGEVPLRDREKWTDNENVKVTWLGVLPRERIPDLDRSAHLIFTAELNAACPNSLLEGLACGVPVVGFDVGSISELVGNDAGAAVPYGSNYWKLEPPDISALAEAAFNIMQNPLPFRIAARRRAEELFGVENMIDLYKCALLD
jgi:glycosyltransferase involved in cell wall biosynthesis